ncbi:MULTISPECIES: DNA alkylation repair protein [Sutcliffiella]|uniref:DNA alkylation repair protein n=1 Tax=Sutcliffiella cohnii TaxID=33932 RepID=A0A223KUR4_9BACI|nr:MULTISPECIES: DNA alkylation repair protein [Sutcliffiella]AST93104.1 DNA alkylation repair protein [Sutcliffiella cohnii]WBL14307.1 DNA alkylation repair protein [Sutcliffiella sp. NC1]
MELLQYKRELVQFFKKNRNIEQQQPMEAYMRNQFPFLGIKTPERKLLLKQLFEMKGKPPLEWLHPLTLSLWEEEEREFQYIALQFFGMYQKKLQVNDLSHIEQLVVFKSWWDTVDGLAPLAGTILQHFPSAIENYPDRWIHSENFWLNRTAILYQLKYKEKTDEERLFHYISIHKQSKEFFIQKAIGWALREYSKTAPEVVEAFISSANLAPLSVREGMKIIKKRDVLKVSSD